MRSFVLITAILLIAATAIYLLKQNPEARAPAPVAQKAPQDWNEDGIAWRTFEDGLRQAQAEHKPVCLTFYAEWCPHCRNFGKVFRDPGIIEKSKNFVMIRVDVDKNTEIANAFRPDGTYIPRTYFLSPRGLSDYSLTASVPPPTEYKYFYGESDPASLSAGMDRALKKLK
jgi:thiol-disulfide isomerase/thioredoxin